MILSNGCMCGWVYVLWSRSLGMAVISVSTLKATDTPMVYHTLALIHTQGKPLACRITNSMTTGLYLGFQEGTCVLVMLVL